MANDNKWLWIIGIILIGSFLYFKPDLSFMGATLGIETFPTQLPEWEELTPISAGYQGQISAYQRIPTSLKGITCNPSGSDCPGCWGKLLIENTKLVSYGAWSRLLENSEGYAIIGPPGTCELAIYPSSVKNPYDGTFLSPNKPSNGEYEDTYVKITKLSPDGCSLNIHSKLVENNIFDLQIIKETQGYYEDTSPQKVYIKINSKYIQDVNVMIYAWIEHKTGSFGSEIKYFDLSKEILMSPGEHTYDLFIPEGLVIGQYDLYVILAKSMPTIVYGTPSSPKCPYYSAQLRLSEGDSTSFLINPKRTYYIINEGQSCPNLYEPYPESSTLCVREDIEDLACIQLGCPSAIDPLTGKFSIYKCGSDGFCSETLVWANDCKSNTDCPEGMSCDLDSAACYLTVIEYQIITKECSVQEDCSKLCDEQTVECISGKCVRTKCEPILTSCEIKNCPIGYSCGEDGLCLKETIVKEPTKPTPTTKFNYFYILIPLIIIGVLFLIFRKK